MYGYIKGTVARITPANIILDNSGIGYLVIVPNPYQFTLGEEVVIYIHQYVREDALELYGFRSIEAKDLFLKLISVKGIGPKSALSILATGNVTDVLLAIDSGDAAYLQKFPGIGQKASQQIILDLKGKICLDELPNTTGMDDLIEALASLGYSKKEILKIVPKLDSSLPIGELVKQALKLFLK